MKTTLTITLRTLTLVDVWSLRVAAIVMFFSVGVLEMAQALDSEWDVAAVWWVIAICTSWVGIRIARRIQ